MTSFNTLETSRESSRPLEIYEVVVGNNAYRFTSAEDSITIGSDVFEPKAVARNAIEQGSDSQARNLILTMPGNDPLPARYRHIAPSEKATVKVWRLQRDEVPTFNTKILLFTGHVMSVRFPQNGYTAEITVRSAEQALNRNVPRFTFTAMCNHVLYDERCQADPNLFDLIGTVSAASGATITLPGVGSQPDQFYRGGYVRTIAGDPDFRLILAQVGDVLTLLLPFAVNPVGVTMQVFSGCDHVVTGDCALRYDKVANFGGFPFVPRRNPFVDGLR